MSDEAITDGELHEQEELQGEQAREEIVAKELERLAGLEGFDYELARQTAAASLGVRVRQLDLAVDQRRAQNGGAAGNDPLGLHDTKAWPDPVDGMELLNAIAESMRKHVIMAA